MHGAWEWPGLEVEWDDLSIGLDKKGQAPECGIFCDLDLSLQFEVEAKDIIAQKPQLGPATSSSTLSTGVVGLVGTAGIANGAPSAASSAAPAAAAAAAGPPAGTGGGTDGSPRTTNAVNITPEGVRALKEKMASARASAQKREELKKRLAAKKEVHTTKERAPSEASNKSSTDKETERVEQKKAPVERKRLSGTSAAGSSTSKTDRQTEAIRPRRVGKAPRPRARSASSTSKPTPKDDVRPRKRERERDAGNSGKSVKLTPTKAKRVPVKLKAKRMREAQSSQESSEWMSSCDREAPPMRERTKSRRVYNSSSNLVHTRARSRGELRESRGELRETRGELRAPREREREEAPPRIRRRRDHPPPTPATLISQHLRKSRIAPRL